MYGKRRSKEEQQARLDKFTRRGTLKSAEFLDKFRKESGQNFNPKLLNTEHKKAYLNEQSDL